MGKDFLTYAITFCYLGGSIMIKRIFALLLAVLMVAGLFAGCGEQKKPNGGEIILPKPTQTDAGGNVIENQKPYEGVTITMAFYTNYEIDANAWLFKQIKEATGIATDVPTVFEVAEGEEQVRQLMFQRAFKNEGGKTVYENIVYEIRGNGKDFANWTIVERYDLVDGDGNGKSIYD